MRRPNTSTFPDDLTNPEMAFMSVVLPAPFVPMSPTTSPGRTSIDAPTTAYRPPNRTIMSLATSGIGATPSSAASSRARVDKWASVAVPVRTDGFQFVRRAMKSRSMSRPEFTIEISPPGQ